MNKHELLNIYVRSEFTRRLEVRFGLAVRKCRVTEEVNVCNTNNAVCYIYHLRKGLSNVSPTLQTIPVKTGEGLLA
jgi:hypothetical protein